MKTNAKLEFAMRNKSAITKLTMKRAQCRLEQLFVGTVPVLADCDTLLSMLESTVW
jgi:hypothetical protein